jgi:TolA-binding protein
MPQPERSTRHNSLGSPERTYIDGLAAERAGNYQEAVEKLGHTLTTLKSNAQRTEARYYYARSLEGLGRLDEAAEQYRRVSQSNDSLSHAALIDYCRTLGRLGENERARTLVLQFLRRHPGSSQVPEAQRLLQTL